MPNDRRNISSNNSLMDLYPTSIAISNALYHSTNKNSAVNKIANIKIGHTDTCVSSRTAGIIYDKYCEYAGSARRR